MNCFRILVDSFEPYGLHFNKGSSLVINILPSLGWLKGEQIFHLFVAILKIGGFKSMIKGSYF